MITCKRCQFVENRDDSLFCAQCGALLHAAPAMARPTQLLNLPRPANRPITRKQHDGQLGPNDIALYVADFENPLIVSVTHETILGRVNRIPSVTPQPA